jgi:hypothetical protein
MPVRRSERSAGQLRGAHLLKLTTAMLAVALASSAGAAGWRSLRVDASSEAAFEQSLAEFKDELSPARRYVFGEALKDIWLHGSQLATTEQRDYTAADYYRQVDGLGYEEIVTLVDPTGKTARRYRAAYNPRLVGDRGGHRASTGAAPAQSPWPEQPPPIGFSGEQVRGGIELHGPGRPPE